jgi:hypothetical protein
MHGMTEHCAMLLKVQAMEMLYKEMVCMKPHLETGAPKDRAIILSQANVLSIPTLTLAFLLVSERGMD